jgi:2-polyprenyl-3-methyl-5-hydroxy-6-metoxy-1,4-benzoquinol methylase
MPSFETRSDEIEIMDDLDCQGEVVDQTLRELEIINALLGGNYVTLSGIYKLLKTNNFPSHVSIADLGCGGGDILKLISRRAKQYNAKLNLTGIDANPNIIKFAAQNTPESFQIRYEAVDILSEEFKSRKFDIIIGTLFFHHFSSQQLTDLFRQLKNQANIGIVVNDIHRHWFAYYSIKVLTQLFSRSAMVKFDAPLSVQRAFRKQDLLEILKNAGIQNFSIRWMWAFRWQVIIPGKN